MGTHQTLRVPSTVKDGTLFFKWRSSEALSLHYTRGDYYFPLRRHRMLGGSPSFSTWRRVLHPLPAPQDNTACPAGIRMIAKHVTWGRRPFLCHSLLPCRLQRRDWSADGKTEPRGKSEFYKVESEMAGLGGSALISQLRRWVLFFLFLFFLAASCSSLMWDLSSQTQGWSPGHSSESPES